MLRKLLQAVLTVGFVAATASGNFAQDNPYIHVVVNMVQLNVAVTDKKGN